jgi:hypothetical protein
MCHLQGSEIACRRRKEKKIYGAKWTRTSGS